MLKCTNAQMTKCKSAQMHKCTNAHMRKCTKAPLPHAQIPNAQNVKCINESGRGKVLESTIVQFEQKSLLFNYFTVLNWYFLHNYENSTFPHFPSHRLKCANAHFSFLPSTDVPCSYAAINGTASCENSALLTTWARKSQGFQGNVVTDCGALSMSSEPKDEVSICAFVHFI